MVAGAGAGQRRYRLVLAIKDTVMQWMQKSFDMQRKNPILYGKLSVLPTDAVRVSFLSKALFCHPSQ